MKRQRPLKTISVFFVFCLGLASAPSSIVASVNDSGGSELGDLAGALRGRQSGREAVDGPEINVCSSWAGISINLTQDQTEARFQCGPKTVLAPLQNPDEKVYLEEDCRSATLLKDAVPGAEWAAIDETKGAYKLTLPPHRKKAETLYYRCKSEALIVAEISLIWFIKQYHEASEEARKKILETLSRYYDLVRVITLVIAGIIERKVKIIKAIKALLQLANQTVHDLLEREEVVQAIEDLYNYIKQHIPEIDKHLKAIVEAIKGLVDYVKNLISQKLAERWELITELLKNVADATGVTCKVKIVAKEEPLAGDPGNEKTCSDAKHPVYIKLGKGEREAVFKCGDGLTTLEPSQNTDKPKFCESIDCNDTAELETTFPGAYWDERNKKANIYRLVIPTVSRKDTRMYYKCKGTSDSADPCTVLINVKSTETDDDEEEDVQECTVGTEKKVTLSPTDTVKFKCNLGTVVQPSFSTATPKVFDDSDGSCSAQASLTSLVDASLTEDSSHGKYTMYTMNLNARPAETKNLCLQCSSGKQNCKMRIHVPGTDSTSSGPGSLSGFLSSVVGLVVCAGFFLVY
ncbi:SAG-related sequence SRS59K [Toxoplasma gondii VEG]|uniref:SAG-related sequence SRS59K n=1 Tax=Toxoplasma gondii (strain ATCC 50861 / VEG) TaxID=432359 RepID=V4Z2X6_TOXGV|nr:SAG-related sequence SRS59K [Toxoplasma gondii VEG]CEL78714.1 TPA: SRS59A, SRS59B (combined genes) [Toxoplasma gondii VEG]